MRPKGMGCCQPSELLYLISDSSLWQLKLSANEFEQGHTKTLKVSDFVQFFRFWSKCVEIWPRCLKKLSQNLSLGLQNSCPAKFCV